MLRCSKCCETKQTHELSARSRSANGRQYVRRSCQSRYQAARKEQKSTVGAERPAQRPAEQLYLLCYPVFGLACQDGDIVQDYPAASTGSGGAE